MHLQNDSQIAIFLPWHPTEGLCLSIKCSRSMQLCELRQSESAAFSWFDCGLAGKSLQM